MPPARDAFEWTGAGGRGLRHRPPRRAAGPPRRRGLPGLPPEILAIPLAGHTRIAVDDGDRCWLLHAGDAYFHRSRIVGGATPPPMRLFERLVAIDPARVLDNHRRLGELARDPGVEVFSSHDPAELARLAARPA